MAPEWLLKLRGLFVPAAVPPRQGTRSAVNAPEPTESRAFELHGCRELLRAYPDILPISSAIDIIERLIPTDPGLAFTHCRGLLETVCKTILADRGVTTATDAKSSQIMSATLKVLKLTPADFDDDERVETGVEDLFRGINQMVSGVAKLRNSQGVGPHGRDALEAVLDSEYAIITASATDSMVCLLFRIHRKQAERDPLKRLRFGDYPDFDAFLDEKHPDIAIEETPIQASKALCLVEPEAYRQSLMAFLDSPRVAEAHDDFVAGEELTEDADE